MGAARSVDACQAVAHSYRHRPARPPARRDRRPPDVGKSGAHGQRIDERVAQAAAWSRWSSPSYRGGSVIAAAAPRVHRSRHILQSLDMYSRRQPPDRTRIWTSHRPQPASSQFAIGSLFVASAPSIACSRAAHADGQSSLRLHRGRQISARVSRGAARRSGAQSSRAVLDTAVGIAAERSARSIDTDRGHAQRCPVSRLDGRSEG